MMWGKGHMIAASALLAMAGTAMAQQNNEGFERPLGGARNAERGGGGGGAGAGNVQMYFSQVDGDTRYELIIREGKTTAKINGEEVPEDRVRRRDGKVEILDEKGNVLTTFNTGNVRIGPRAQVRGLGPGRALEVPEAPVQVEMKPRVMIGVMMSEPSDSLREHLELKEGETVMIDRLAEGLPAAEAGLKPRDIIVEFDGVKPITESKVREIIASKQEGDKIRVEFLRKGEVKDTTIELKKVDPSSVKSWLGGAPQAAAPGMAWGRGQGWGENEWPQNVPGIDPEFIEKLQGMQDPKEIEKLLQEHGMGGRGRVFLQGPEGRWQGFVAPKGEAQQAELDAQRAALGAQRAALDAQMKALKEQIEAVRKQTAELQKMMEEMKKSKQ